MQRHEQVIQLSNHVKNKLRKHKHPSTISYPNSPDEFIETTNINDDNYSSLSTPENLNRSRRNTFTTYQVQQPSEPFFTYQKPANISFLQQQYAKQRQCQECLRRDHLIHVERQRLLHINNEYKKLNEQFRSSVLLNHQYEEENRKLKNHLTKLNSHLYEYQRNFHQFKEKILPPEKKITTPKVIEAEEEDMTNDDHLKRLRYEVEMYNRIVAAKQEEERKQIEFLY